VDRRASDVMRSTSAPWRRMLRNIQDRRGDPAELAVVIVVFVVLAALSLVNRNASVLLCTGYAVVLALTAPRLGWCLLLFVVPFQYFFHLEIDDFGRCIAVIMLALSLRTAFGMAMTRRVTMGNYGLILLAYIALVAAHLDFRDIDHDA